jgi:hypothetical protein
MHLLTKLVNILPIPIHKQETIKCSLLKVKTLQIWSPGSWQNLQLMTLHCFSTSRSSDRLCHDRPLEDCTIYFPLGRNRYQDAVITMTQLHVSIWASPLPADRARVDDKVKRGSCQGDKSSCSRVEKEKRA